MSFKIATLFESAAPPAVILWDDFLDLDQDNVDEWLGDVVGTLISNGNIPVTLHVEEDDTGYNVGVENRNVIIKCKYQGELSPEKHSDLYAVVDDLTLGVDGGGEATGVELGVIIEDVSVDEESSIISFEITDVGIDFRGWSSIEGPEDDRDYADYEPDRYISPNDYSEKY